MIKKLAVTILGILGLLAAAGWFVLATESGLRWTIGQVLARAGAPVEIARVDGRLIGPLSLGGVSYRAPETGAAMRVDTVELDWRPVDLLTGVLHVSRLRVAGVEYAGGESSGSSGPGGPPTPDFALPLEVRLDRLEVESVSVAAGDGAPVRIGYASLKGALDAEAVTLEDIQVAAGRYGVDNGRVRVGLDETLPIEVSLDWRAEPEGYPALQGTLETGGALVGTLEPAVTLDGPFTANAQGSVTGLFDTPSWTATVAVPESISLDTIRPDWPPLSVAGRVEAQGDMSRARLQPDLSLVYQEHEVALTGDAVVTAEELTVDRARLWRPNGDTIEVSGRVDFDTTRWTATAEVPEAVSLDGIQADWPAVAVAGRVEAEGDSVEAHLLPDLALAYRDREVTLAGDAVVSAQRLTVNRARLQQPGGGAIDVSGRMDFETRRWTATADIPEPVSLDRIEAGWPPVSIAGRIEAEGDTSRARLQPDLSLVYDDRDARLTGDAVVSADGLTVHRARLQRPAGDTIDVSGRVDWDGNLPFSVRGEWQALRGPDAAPWSSREGELRAEGDIHQVTASLSGVVSPPDQDAESPVTIELTARDLDQSPAVTGTVRLPYFRLGEITARELGAEVDFDADSLDSTVSVQAAAIEYGERVVNDLALQAEGNPEDHVLTLSGQYRDWTVNTRVTGTYTEDQWQATVRELSAGPPEATWRTAAPAGLAWSPDATRLEQLCLRQGGAEICAGGRFAPDGQWGADVAASGIPLRWLAANAPPELRVAGTIAGRARVESAEAGMQGEASAGVERATVEWRGENPVTTRYENIELIATLEPDVLRARLGGRVEDAGTIEGELITRDPLAENGALNGRLSARLPSLRLLQAFVPALGLRDGSAVAALRIGGTRSAPSFEGEARIEDAVVEVAPLGIRLSALNLTAQGEPGEPLRLDARAASGEGTFTAQGELGPGAGGAWQGEIMVRGERAELVSLPRALIEGSPDLRVTIDPGGGRVEGRIDITRAALTPDAGRPGITISDDIVVLSKEPSRKAAANPMAWHANVTIDLGDDTRFAGYGLKGRLSGAVQLDAPPHQPTRANGRIEIHDGQYRLYGRSFDIRQGLLVYTGGPVDNPGIELRLGREAGDVSVTLSVTGPLVEPSLTLSSSRPMSETDKMSYLLLGRPASQASEAETTLLFQAATSLMPGGARDVPGYIRSTLGLDTVEVRSGNGDGEAEGASVVLGKYLSPRLYVSYVAGFQEAVDVFRVRYELARHWLLRAESSTRESGGDLLFTW